MKVIYSCSPCCFCSMSPHLTEVFSCYINSCIRQMLCRSFMGPSGIMWTERAGPYHHRLSRVSSRRWRRHSSQTLQIQEEEKLWAGEGTGQRAGSWGNKYEAWVNKDRYFSQCSKSIDHESIPCPVLWLCGLGVGTDYLLWIPSLTLKLSHSPGHGYKHKHINLSQKTNSFRSSALHPSPPPRLLSEVAKVSERYVCLFPLHWRVNSVQCNEKWVTNSLKGLCHSSLSWTNSKLISSRLISLCSPLNFR